jgi:hypothetical protein
MQRLEVSGAVQYIYIYHRRLKVNVIISYVVWKNSVRRWEYLEMDETCKFDHKFYFTVDVTTLGSMHKSWSSSICNAAHDWSYLNADICPRILFLDTCCVCLSFTCLTCAWHVTWMLLSLSDKEESIFPELGHSVNRT